MKNDKEIRKKLPDAELDEAAGGIIAEQFAELPMSKLVGGPLRAVCDAQKQLARTTEEFIKRVGVETAGTDGKK